MATATSAKPGVESQYGPSMPNSPRNALITPKSPLNISFHTSAIATGMARYGRKNIVRYTIVPRSVGRFSSAARPTAMGTPSNTMRM